MRPHVHAVLSHAHVCCSPPSCPQAAREHAVALQAELQTARDRLAQLERDADATEARSRRAREEHSQAEALVGACALLARALGPLRQRFAEVAAQKRFLYREYLARAGVEQQAVALMHAVRRDAGLESGDDEPTRGGARASVGDLGGRRCCSSLRSAVLAVMAANRLRALGASATGVALGQPFTTRRGASVVFLAAPADASADGQRDVRAGDDNSDNALSAFLPLPPQPFERGDGASHASRSPRGSRDGAGAGSGYYFARASATTTTTATHASAAAGMGTASADADRVLQLLRHFQPSAWTGGASWGADADPGVVELLYRGLKRYARRRRSGGGRMHDSTTAEDAMSAVRSSVLTMLRDAAEQRSRATVAERELATARVEVRSLSEQVEAAQAALTKSQALASFLEARVHELQQEAVSCVPGSKLDEARTAAQTAASEAAERSRALAAANQSLAAHHAKILELHEELRKARGAAEESQAVAAKAGARARARASEVSRLRQYITDVEQSLGELQVRASACALHECGCAAVWLWLNSSARDGAGVRLRACTAVCLCACVAGLCGRVGVCWWCNRTHTCGAGQRPEPLQ